MEGQELGSEFHTTSLFDSAEGLIIVFLPQLLAGFQTVMALAKAVGKLQDQRELAGTSSPGLDLS